MWAHNCHGITNVAGLIITPRLYGIFVSTCKLVVNTLCIEENPRNLDWRVIWNKMWTLLHCFTFWLYCNSCQVSCLSWHRKIIIICIYIYVFHLWTTSGRTASFSLKCSDDGQFFWCIVCKYYIYIYVIFLHGSGDGGMVGWWWTTFLAKTRCVCFVWICPKYLESPNLGSLSLNIIEKHHKLKMLKIWIAQVPGNFWPGNPGWGWWMASLVACKREKMPCV